MYAEKTVLITGSSRGVGKMLVEHFLQHHAHVIGVSKGHQWDSLHYHYYQMDLSNIDNILTGFNEIKDSYASIDILINNAAVLTSQYAMKMTPADAQAMVLVDMLAPFLVTRECSKLMCSGGRVVNISSMAVLLEPMGDSVYAGCKAGMEKMGNIMAKEFSTFGITVNTLGITAIETDMLRQLNKERVDKVVAGLPIPRYATIEDIANVIDFFCSPKSSYITAQTIYLGGVHG